MTNTLTNESAAVVLRGQLITRKLARMHRNRIENALDKQESVTIDLSRLN